MSFVFTVVRFYNRRKMGHFCEKDVLTNCLPVEGVGIGSFSQFLFSSRRVKLHQYVSIKYCMHLQGIRLIVPTSHFLKILPMLLKLSRSLC